MLEAQKNKILDKLGFDEKQKHIFNKWNPILCGIAIFMATLYVVFRIYGRLGFEKTILLYMTVIIYRMKRK